MSNHQEVATKISEALKAAAQCSAAETVENYSVLSEQLWELNSLLGAARDVVGIRCGAISGNMKVSFQAARSIG